MEVGAKYLLFVYSDRGRTMVDNCGNSEVFSVSSQKLRDVRRLKASERRMTRNHSDRRRTAKRGASSAVSAGTWNASD